MKSAGINTKNAAETKELAGKIAKEIKRRHNRKTAIIIALSGNLGSGKTTFVQGFAKGLGIKEIPKSPTFILMQVFPFAQTVRKLSLRGVRSLALRSGQAPQSLKNIMKSRLLRSCSSLAMTKGVIFKQSVKSLVHIDAYRLEKPKELLHLGFREILRDPHNVVIIEWAEKVKKLLPKDAIWIYFKHARKNRRKIFINFPTNYE